MTFHAHYEPEPTMGERLAEYARAHAVAAREDGRPCPCGGGGWVLSPFDTWERCPIHEGPHPADLEAEAEAEWEAERQARLEDLRARWRAAKGDPAERARLEALAAEV